MSGRKVAVRQTSAAGEGAVGNKSNVLRIFVVAGFSLNRGYRLTGRATRGPITENYNA